MLLNTLGAAAATIPLIGMTKYSLDRIRPGKSPKPVAELAGTWSEKSDTSLYSPECTSAPFRGDLVNGRLVSVPVEDLAGEYAGNPKLMRMQASQLAYGIIAGESGVLAYAAGHTQKEIENENWKGWDYSKAEGRLGPGSFLALETKLAHSVDGRPLDTSDYARLYVQSYSFEPMQGFPSCFVGWTETGKPTGSGNVLAAVRAMMSADIFSKGFQGSPGLVTRQAIRMAAADGSSREAIKGGAVAAGCAWLAITGASKGAIRKYAEQYYDLEEAAIRMDEAPQSCRYAVPYAINRFLGQKCLEDTIYEIASDGGAAYAGAGAIAGGIACVAYGLTKEDREWIHGFLPSRYSGITI